MKVSDLQRKFVDVPIEQRDGKNSTDERGPRAILALCFFRESSFELLVAAEIDLKNVASLLCSSLFAQRVGWPDQLLARADAIAADEQPYFSLLLIRQGWPEVLP